MTVGEICTILGVVISAISVIAAVLRNGKQEKEKAAAQMLANKDTLIRFETKMDSLSEKVQKHNNMIERVYKLEGQMQECQHDIRDMKARSNANDK